MNPSMKKYSLLFLKIIVALPFLGAGIAKIFGVEMMVDTFETIGFGQWLRYLTGIIEIASAILLFVPNKQFYGALLLVCTMIGAVGAHLFWLGPSAVPALILGALAGIIGFIYRPNKIAS